MLPPVSSGAGSASRTPKTSPIANTPCSGTEGVRWSRQMVDAGSRREASSPSKGMAVVAIQAGGGSGSCSPRLLPARCHRSSSRR